MDTALADPQADSKIKSITRKPIFKHYERFKSEVKTHGDPVEQSLETKEAFLSDELDHLTLQSPSFPPQPQLHLDTTNNLTGEENLIADTYSNVTETTEPTPSTPSKWKSAFQEAKYFAGGLIHHPVESTKHYSILRHSHGLVYYQGSATNVAISIFSDKPLPPGHTLWLQSKGWMGKTGMNARKLVGLTGSWINVTPSTQVTAMELPPSNERAWQRDIRKFLEKGPAGHSRKHEIRETAIVRIPATVADGYFRLILRGGDKDQKTLCPSPVFRVASLSNSAAKFRGASLSTLPLELGVKAASLTASSYASTVAQPITSAVQSNLSTYLPQPSFWQKTAGEVVYSASGLQARVDSVSDAYDKSRDLSFAKIGEDTLDDFDVIKTKNIDDKLGPQPPFPIRLSGTVTADTGLSAQERGIPTANLKSVPNDILRQLQSGEYIGWARLTPSKKNRKDTIDPPLGWCKALIYVSPRGGMRHASPDVPKKCISVHLLYDFCREQFEDTKISVVLLALLAVKPPPNPGVQRYDSKSEFEPHDAHLTETARHIEIAETILESPNWTIEVIEQKEKTSRGISGRYVQAREAVQRQIDRVPLDQAGIRTETMALQEKVDERGGLFVLRG